jgi:hypothetical protein
MILIADSGSSKTDWRVIHDNGEISQFRTIGFNPFYQTADQMEEGMRTKDLLELKGKITQVFFYGSGCTSEKNNIIVAHTLNKMYKSAIVHVDHDLMAAARATCGHLPGIACILGTGSNSGDYNGQHIISNRPSPGYLLGDEGGGSYIGKQFLQDFIYEDMPAKIRDLAIQEYQLTNLAIQENVYQKPFPNRYMAGFCHFITRHKSEPYCYLLYYNGFKDFFTRHVMRYKDYKGKNVNFVGSIAYYNSDILRKVASDLGIQVNIILETPIAGLTLYHKENL